MAGAFEVGIAAASLDAHARLDRVECRTGSVDASIGPKANFALRSVRSHTADICRISGPAFVDAGRMVGLRSNVHLRAAVLGCDASAGVRGVGRDDER